MAKLNKKTTQKPPKKVDYEQLGRALESIVVTGYFDKKRVLKMAFYRGIFTGLGSIIGATIVVALLLWVLSLFESVPFIGPIFENIEGTIDTQADTL